MPRPGVGPPDRRYGRAGARCHADTACCFCTLLSSRQSSSCGACRFGTVAARLLAPRWRDSLGSTGVRHLGRIQPARRRVLARARRRVLARDRGRQFASRAPPWRFRESRVDRSTSAGIADRALRSRVPQDLDHRDPGRRPGARTGPRGKGLRGPSTNRRDLNTRAAPQGSEQACLFLLMWRAVSDGWEGSLNALLIDVRTALELRCVLPLEARASRPAGTEHAYVVARTTTNEA